MTHAFLNEILENAHVVSLPMRVRFRGVEQREAVIFRGPCGWGEFSPFVEYEAPEAAAWLASGIEMAYQDLPRFHRTKVAVNATIPAVPADHVAEILAQFPGCTVVKVKVAEAGQTLADDVARVEAVREQLPHARIRVDANRGWGVEQALEAAAALGPLDYMEQPCATVAELAQLRTQLVRRGHFVRVAADESIRRAADPYEVARVGAADIAVVKVAPLGGVRAVLELAQYMHARGMDLTVASALDTGVGMNAGLAAVAALPRHFDDEEFVVEPAAAGLATQRLFAADIVRPRELVDGCLAVEMLEPDMDAVSDLAASPHRKDWWLQHLADSFAHIPTGRVAAWQS
ncbi:MAG: o-succinylbenzoate synthase [Corynebacterium sp.]|nr:o-succinylbenzoate synthase [Corynebacterium sp.]